MGNFESIQAAIIAGDSVTVKQLVTDDLSKGISAADIIAQGLIGGMNVIAERFRNNEIFVPEVMLAAKAMQAGLTLIKPLLAGTVHQPLGKIIIGTVQGDQHDIGKNLVGMMFEGAGFAVTDLGSNVAVEKFIAAVRENKPDILALSALLTTTMPRMAETIQRLKDEGLREGVKVMIGGAPVSESYAVKIGADGYAPDAGAAVAVAKSLMGVTL
ncbi:MAG TPA: corrinoid protein [Bacillota bacterium]